MKTIKLTLNKKTIANLKNDWMSELKGGKCSETPFNYPTATITPCPCETEQACQTIVGCTQAECTEIIC